MVSRDGSVTKLGYLQELNIFAQLKYLLNYFYAYYEILIKFKIPLCMVY